MSVREGGWGDGAGELVVAGTVRAQFPGPALAPGAVMVRGRSIVAIGHAEDLLQAFPSAKRTDLGNAVLLPGFIDAHVHLAFDATEAAVAHYQCLGDDERLALMLDHAATLLRAGVTTARDLGAPGRLVYEVRRRIDEGEADGPNIVCSGPPLTTPGGHVWYFGGEVSGEQALREAVRQRQAAGAEWVKLIISGGYLTEGTDPALPQFSAEDIAAVVDEANRVGLPVAAHVHATDHIVTAQQAGVATIEHCTLVGADDARAEVVAAIAASGTPVCPTVNAGTLRLPPPGGPAAITRLALLVRAGVRIVMGTDAGVPGSPHNGYAEGLMLLGRAGMTNADALAAATSAAADALGLGGVTGCLRAGLRADMVALGSDPVEDLGAASDVRWVMNAGRAVPARATRPLAAPASP